MNKMIEIKKPNDIIVAAFNNPHATTYDLMSSLDLNPDNTSLYSKDEYKKSNFIQKNFKDDKGEFDNLAFDKFYQMAENHYKLMSDEQYLKSLDEVWYSPFDVTRPKDAKTFSVSVDFAKDYNPFKQTYGRTGLFSVEDSPLSLRELAQQGKIFDSEKQEFLDESVNDRSILGKIFGKTLVYAQWDEDGTHEDPLSGRIVKHKKGDWKINPDGNLYVETLGKREVYGKQVVNPMDVLTTDGSFANKFDIFDSDNKESNALRTTLKIGVEIAPLFIPGVNLWYGGARAALGLASALPTLYKSIEGILSGDNISPANKVATAAEGYMAKFVASSTTDEAQGSLFNYEQIASMVSDIFSQIYEQRAAASLSKIFYHPSKMKLDAKQQELLNKLNAEVFKGGMAGKFSSMDEMKKVQQLAAAKVPGLQEFQKAQSAMSKSFSLGYMALTSTADIYGEAIEGGYDRRTAGFAGLMAASGTYALMMNNRMGDWFLDKSTGYTVETNKALMRKAIKPYFSAIDDAMVHTNSSTQTKSKLLSSVIGIKNKLSDIMNNSSVIGEAMWKNAFIEGIEEVTEELVIDSTKGVVDVLAHLGLTKKKGTFGGVENVFSKEGLERYIASFLGGTLGGALFEFNRSKVEPWITGEQISFDAKQAVMSFVANGQTDLLIDEINKNRKRLGNKYITPFVVEGDSVAVDENGFSHADAVADIAISIVKNIDGVMNAEGLVMSDEEIIKKAIRDYIVIRDLSETSPEGKLIGIEGLVVDDFRDHSKALVDINLDIQKLKAKEGDNKEGIKQLEEKAKIHRDILNKIKDGKLSMEYFEKMLFYLNKDVSKHWVALDLNTYVEIQYNKEYHSLPETGLGITKDLVKKEWKQYIESNDLKQHLNVAWNAYKKLEKDSNKPAFEYSESGYAEERRKILKSFMDVDFNKALFDTSNKNEVIKNINRFIEISRYQEKVTGKKVIPWDSISVDIMDKLNEEGLFSNKNGAPLSDTHFQEKIKDGEEHKTKGEVIRNLMTLVMKSLPTDNLNYDLIREVFNQNILSHNNKILAKIEDLEAGINDTNRTEVEAEIKELNNSKLDVYLFNIERSKLYSEQEAKKLPLISDKLQQLQLTQEIADGFTPEIMNKSLQDYSTTLENFAKSINKEVSDLTSEEIINALVNFVSINSILNQGNDILIPLITSDNIDKFNQVEQIVNSIYDSFEQLKKNVSEYKEFLKEQYKDIILPEIVNPINYTLDVILNEIKQNKSLDAELVIKLEEIFTNILDKVLTDNVKYYSLDYNQLIDIVDNIQEIQNNLGEVRTILEESDTLDLSILPKYIQDIINNQENKEDALDNWISDISSIYSNLKSINPIISKLKEIKEIIDNKDKFITNTIYDFLNNFMLSLEDEKVKRQKTIFDILKSENITLFNSSDITNYVKEGLQEKDMVQAINTIKLLKSVIYGMSVTEISVEDPYGLITLRKQFAEKHKLEDDVKKLKTINSDIVELIHKDLDRIQIKLEFLTELSKFNSGKIHLEQEEIRRVTNRHLLEGWEYLSNNKVNLSFPDYFDILENGSLNDEKKLLEIESRFFEYYKDSPRETKIELVKLLTEKYKFTNVLSEIYNKDGSNKITKESKSISNNDFLLYMISNLVLYSKDFNNKLRLILELKEFDKSPFFTQELSEKIMYASIIDPELFSEFVQQTAYNMNHLTDLITYALGNAGTGKTAVLFKSIIYLLKDSNPNLNIWFSAPNSDKVADLKENVLSGIDYTGFSTNSLTKHQLFEELGLTQLLNELKKPNSEFITIEQTKEKIKKLKINNLSELIENYRRNDLPDLIFIDEISHFDAIELEVLNEFSRKTLESGKITKIIGAGDQIQLGSINNNLNGVSYNIDRVSGIFTPQLTLTVRAANSQQRENSDYLSGLLNSAISIWSNPSNSPEVMNLIEKGILFKGHVSSDVIAGTIQGKENLIPTDVLESLKRIKQNNSNIKIGLLSKTLTGTWDNEQLYNQLENAGLLENVKLFTEGNIQGSEVDYFLLPKSFLKGHHILNSLRRLYTYTTRAKQATIILDDIKDLDNGDETTLNLYYENQDTSVPVKPLKPELIEANKQERITKLKEILNPDFDIKYDYFKFGHIILDSVDDDFDVTNTNLETEEYNPITDFTKEKFKYRLHSFYNDLNVKVTRNKDNTVTLRKSNNNVPYGLDYLFTDSNEITIPNDKFEREVEVIVSLKNDIWNTLNKTKNKKFTVDESNPIINLIFGKDKISSTLVAKKTKYNRDFNSAYDKLLNNSENQLEEESDYINLYLKISSDSKDYYVHLATFPKLETAQEWYKNDKPSYDKYKEFIDELEDEIEINKESINLKTSTRLLKSDSKPEYTLERISKIKGLYFLNDRNSFVKEPVINIFPSDFDSFKSLYNSTKFGEAISDEKLKELFEGKIDPITKSKSSGYKGKPYIAVTFLRNMSQVKFVLLKHKPRTLEQIEKIVANPLNTGESAKELILSGKSEDVWGTIESLFNGNQVLNMLISLAVQKPDLFIKFFESGDNILEQTKQQYKNDPTVSTFLDKYLPKIKSIFDFNRPLVDHIAYPGKSKDGQEIESALKDVYNLIRNELNVAKRSGSTLTEKLLKEKIISKIRGHRDKKVWFRKFWNIVSYKQTLKSLVSSAKSSGDFIPEILTIYEDHLHTLDQMFNFWKGNFDDKFYFNLPLKKSGDGYVINNVPESLTNTYITLTPESPYYDLDLSDLQPVKRTKDPLKSLKSKLSKIKYNGNIIFNSNHTDTEDILNDKIERATLISNILGHKDNTFTLNELIDLNKDELLTTFKSLTIPTKKVTLEKILEELNLLSENKNWVKVFSDNFQMLFSEDSLNEDKLAGQEIINKWNNKTFNGKTLLEFLNSLPSEDDIELLFQFYENLPDADLVNIELGEDFVTTSLTSYILNKLNIKLNPNLDLFFNCLT